MPGAAKFVCQGYNYYTAILHVTSENEYKFVFSTSYAISVFELPSIEASHCRVST